MYQADQLKTCREEGTEEDTRLSIWTQVIHVLMDTAGFGISVLRVVSMLLH